MIHRNTYINAPSILDPTWQSRRHDGLFFAGQLSGVEGYVESAASGLIAGLAAAALAAGQRFDAPPRTTALGAIAHYVSHANPANYQPTNVAFGLLTPLERAPRQKRARRQAMAQRALDALEAWHADVSPGQAHETAPQAFLDYLRLNRNASRHTVLAYRGDLTQFVSFVEAREVDRRVGPHDLTHQTVRKFLAELYRDGIEASTASRKLAAIRSFARYLRREGILDHDPGSLIASPRLARKIPAHLDINEVGALLDAPDVSTPLGRRDQAILELFYASGLRLSELVGTDVEDVNLSSRMLRVLGKGERSGSCRSTAQRPSRFADIFRIASGSSGRPSRVKAAAPNPRCL